MTPKRLAVPARLRRRLTWTTAMVLISLGGAGLAAAADRPATDTARPELTAHSDQLASSWLEAMSSQAHAVADRVDALSQDGRDVLAQMQGLDPAQIGNALAAGDQSGADLEIAASTLADLRYAGPEQLDETRLSQANRRLLAAIDEVIGAAVPMPAAWHSIAADTREVANLLVALLTHDGLVFRATTAGRQKDWTGALDLLGQGGTSLGQARAVRDHLAASNDVSTLDDLLGRYAAYDAALTDLYTALRDGASLDSQQVQRLSAKVDQAEAGLPADTDALKVVVADASGGSVAEGVVNLEEARGKVTEAVGRLP
jgi:hypothetical protein